MCIRLRAHTDPNTGFTRVLAMLVSLGKRAQDMASQGYPVPTRQI